MLRQSHLFLGNYQYFWGLKCFFVQGNNTPTRLRIEPGSPDLESDALTTRLVHPQTFIKFKSHHISIGFIYHLIPLPRLDLMKTASSPLNLLGSTDPQFETQYIIVLKLAHLIQNYNISVKLT